MSLLTRSLKALGLPLLLALLWWLPAGPAQAAVSCTATMTNLAFGTVELVNGSTAAPTTATLNYNCTNDSTSAIEQVRVCFNIGDGNEGLGNFNPRVMETTAGNQLRFQLYQATSGTIWGSNGNAAVPNPFVVTMSIPRRTTAGGLGRVTGSTTMRGELLPLQGVVPPGNYQDNFVGDHTSITLTRSTSGMPATCDTIQPGRFAFLVTATVAKSCLVTADPLNFGTIDGLPGQANRDQTSTINVTCTTPTPYTVALTPSNGSTTGAGTMTPTGGVAGNADTVPYRLYRNAARTTVWGSVAGTGGNTVAGTGNGAAQALTLYGRVLGTSANVRPDSYRDVVTVSVTY